MKIKQVAHLCIGATDLDATFDFYTQVLGLQPGFDFIKDDARIGFYIKAGANTFIEVFVEGQQPTLERVLIRHLCLEVADMDAVIDTVRGKGWAISDKTMGFDNSWQAWITDPSGVSIELMQYTPESTQFTGKPCIITE